jgi:hypothetical protein
LTRTEQQTPQPQPLPLHGPLVRPRPAGRAQPMASSKMVGPAAGGGPGVRHEHPAPRGPRGPAGCHPWPLGLVRPKGAGRLPSMASPWGARQAPLTQAQRHLPLATPSPAGWV